MTAEVFPPTKVQYWRVTSNAGAGWYKADDSMAARLAYIRDHPESDGHSMWVCDISVARPDGLVMNEPRKEDT